MKKLTCLLLAMTMLFALTACVGGTSRASQTSASASAASASAPAASAAQSSSASASSSSAAASDTVYHIGICQLVQHVALDAATKGFREALTDKLGADKVVFDEQNAQGDSATCATICNQFVADGDDLILANATPALQAAASATTRSLSSHVHHDYATAPPHGLQRTTEEHLRNLRPRPLDEQAAMLEDSSPTPRRRHPLLLREPNSYYQASVIEAS